MINIAFVGLPNVGKSTYVNYLSGSHFKVANYLGVSVGVEKKVFTYKKQQLCFIDLPGIYDLNIVSAEENITKKYLEEEKIDLIVEVIDESDLQRGLHLCAQLKKCNIPLIVLLNQKDNKNHTIDLKKLSSSIYTPIIKGDFKDKEKILDTILKNLHTSSTKIFDERSIFIPYINKKQYTLDILFLHPKWGILILSVLFILFFTFIFMMGDKIASLLVSFLYQFTIVFTSYVTISFMKVILYIFLSSLMAISSFVPYLFLIYIGMAILEESGLMARIAYLFDPFMQFFHLSGKSIIPFIIGFGCSVPAILATRTIENEKERRISALLIPFVSCSGKLPVFLLFTNVFFVHARGFVLFLLYFISIMIALFLVFIFTSKQEEYFIMELPSYTFPKIKNIVRKVSMELFIFYRKSLKTIVLGTMIVLFLLPYINMEPIRFLLTPLGFAQNMDVVESLPFGLLSKENLLIFFSNKANNQPLNMFIESLWPFASRKLMALCYLFYVSMSIPCVMTLSAIKSEFGYKFLCFSMAVNIIVPYLFCFILCQSISLLHFLF